MRKLEFTAVFPLAFALFTLLACENPSSTSADDNTDTPGGVPSAPINFSAMPVLHTEIELVWEDASDNESGFDLEWSTLEDFSLKGSEELAADTVSYTVEGLSSGTVYFFRLRATGADGNSEWALTDSETPSPPSGPFTVNSGAAYATSASVTLQMNVTGAVDMRFRNEDGAFSENWEAYAPLKMWTLSSGDGDKTVYAEFRDSMGAVTAQSATVILDTTPPTFPQLLPSLTINDNAGYAVTTVGVIKNSAVGAAEMRYRNANGVWTAWEAHAAAKDWTLPNVQGTQTVFAQFRDEAGNQVEVSDSIIFDSVAPTASFFRINGTSAAAASKAATLTSSVTGVYQMRYSNNGTSWSGWESYVSERSWTLSGAENATVTVWAEFRDQAGNVRSASDTIKLDEWARIRVSLEYIQVDDAMDGGSGGSWNEGEFQWESSCKVYSGTTLTGTYVIHNGSQDNVPISSAIEIFQDEIITVSNATGKFTFLWNIWENDDDNSDDVGVNVSVTYAAPFESDSHYEQFDDNWNAAFWELEVLD